MKSNFIISVLLFALGLFVYVSSYDIAVLAVVDRSGIINSRFFPRLCAILLIIFSAIMALEDYLEGRKRGKESKGNVPSNNGIIYPLGGVSLLCIFYLIMYYPLGHIISTVIFMTIFLYFMSCRSYYILLILPVLLSVSIYLLFRTFLGVPLPEGILGF
jgi:hypothetical protein